MEIRASRVLWTHTCYPCTDPAAHFTGSDEQYARIVEVVRERERLRNFARLIWAYYDVQWAGTRVHEETKAEARALGIVD